MTPDVAVSANFVYVSTMPPNSQEVIRTMLQRFSRDHAFSFAIAPLNPAGTEFAAELNGHGMQVSAAYEDTLRELYLDIRRYGHTADYPSASAKVSDALLAALRRMPGVVTEYQRVPPGYAPGIQAAPTVDHFVPE